MENPHEDVARPLGELAVGDIKRSAFELQPGELPVQDVRDFPTSGTGSPRLAVAEGEEHVFAATESDMNFPQTFRPKQASVSLDWPSLDFDPSHTPDAAMSPGVPHGVDGIDLDRCACKPSTTAGTDKPAAFDHLFWGVEDPQVHGARMCLHVAEDGPASTTPPELRPAQELSLIHISEPTRPY